jgi:hypothetical protein
VFPPEHFVSRSVAPIHCCHFDEKNYIAVPVYLQSLQDFTFLGDPSDATILALQTNAGNAVAEKFWHAMSGKSMSGWKQSITQRQGWGSREETVQKRTRKATGESEVTWKQKNDGSSRGASLSGLRKPPESRLL